MGIYGHIWIHNMDTYGGPRARPWPKTGGGPKWARVPWPWPWARVPGTLPPVVGQDLALGSHMYPYYVSICVHIYPYGSVRLIQAAPPYKIEKDGRCMLNYVSFSEI